MTPEERKKYPKLATKYPKVVTGYPTEHSPTMYTEYVKVKTEPTEVVTTQLEEWSSTLAPSATSQLPTSKHATTGRSVVQVTKQSEGNVIISIFSDFQIYFVLGHIEDKV